MKKQTTTLPRGTAQVDLLTAELKARGKNETQIKVIIAAGRSESGKSRRLVKNLLWGALKRQGRFNDADAMAIMNAACGVNAKHTGTVNTETRRADEADTASDQGSGNTGDQVVDEVPGAVADPVTTERGTEGDTAVV